jgi:hypothetical protein
MRTRIQIQESSTSKLEISSLFLFFLVIFTLLDPDPDPLMPRLFRFYCKFHWYSVGTRYSIYIILKISTASVNYNYLVSALNEITGIISQGS